MKPRESFVRRFLTVPPSVAPSGLHERTYAPLRSPSRGPADPEEDERVAGFTITMTRTKETKGTFVYTEDDNAEGQPPRIGTLYIKKWAATPLGEKITVTCGVPKPGSSH
jgi:hypothetical protein